MIGRTGSTDVSDIGGIDLLAASSLVQSFLSNLHPPFLICPSPHSAGFCSIKLANLHRELFKLRLRMADTTLDLVDCVS